MVKIYLNRSYLLAGILALIHLGAIIIIGLPSLNIPVWLKAILSIILIGSAVFYIRRDALRLATDSIVMLDIADNMNCTAQTKLGNAIECKITGTSCVFPFLTILNLKTDNSRFLKHVVIMQDSIEKNSFRQLRVWLRWKPFPNDA